MLKILHFCKMLAILQLTGTLITLINYFKLPKIVILVITFRMAVGLDFTIGILDANTSLAQVELSKVYIRF